jgi:hypothetical protein
MTGSTSLATTKLNVLAKLVLGEHELLHTSISLIHPTWERDLM